MKILMAAFLVVFSGHVGLAQERTVQVPFDIQRTIRGIDVTITVKEIRTSTDDGTSMKAAFAIPVNGVLIRFEAEGIPIDLNTLDMGPFLLRPLHFLSPQEEQFLWRLMRPHGALYKWWCNCSCDREPVVF